MFKRERWLAAFMGLFLTFSGSALSATSDLPPCPKSEDVFWHNCFADHTFYEGSRYVGPVVNDMREGQGMQIFSTGEAYIGGFHRDQYHGFGANQSVGGRLYVGEFSGGRKHGIIVTLSGPSEATACRYVYSRLLNCAPGKTVDTLTPSLKSEFESWSMIDRLAVQKFMAEAGFYSGDVDGHWGRETLKAILFFSMFQLSRFDISKMEWQADVVHALKRSVAKPPKDRGDFQGLPTSSGTAFFISEDGYLITNAHVASECEEIFYTLRDERYTVDVIHLDEKTDLALLKASFAPVHVFPLADTPIYPLQDIVVVGYPFGSQLSTSVKFTRGIISATTGIANDFSMFQMDAVVQPGNSGGPVLDIDGNVIGVATARLSQKFAERNNTIAEGTSFAIKVDLVKALGSSFGVELVSPSRLPLSSRDLAQRAAAGTVMLRCTNQS